jgi:chromosome segregation ATPase
MSTAGKVLVVLILLVVPIWILLASTVAQLNTEWTQALAKRDQEITKLEKDVQDNERAILDLRDQIALEQGAMESEQAVVRSKLAEVERGKAEMIQIQTGVANQLETLQTSLKTAESAKELRNAEFKAEGAAKAAAEAVVERLKGENSQLMDQLTALRTEFKRIVDSNKKIVESLRKSSVAKPPARRTSLAR